MTGDKITNKLFKLLNLMKLCWNTRSVEFRINVMKDEGWITIMM